MRDSLVSHVKSQISRCKGCEIGRPSILSFHHRLSTLTVSDCLIITDFGLTHMEAISVVEKVTAVPRSRREFLQSPMDEGPIELLVHNGKVKPFLFPLAQHDDTKRKLRRED